MWEVRASAATACIAFISMIPPNSEVVEAADAIRPPGRSSDLSVMIEPGHQPDAIHGRIHFRAVVVDEQQGSDEACSLTARAESSRGLMQEWEEQQFRPSESHFFGFGLEGVITGERIRVDVEVACGGPVGERRAAKSESFEVREIGGQLILYPVDPPVHQWIAFQAWQNLNEATYGDLKSEMSNYLPTDPESDFYSGAYGDFHLPPDWYQDLFWDEPGSDATALIEGAWEEDNPPNRSASHFWDPDSGFDAGLQNPSICEYLTCDSALEAAQDRFYIALSHYRQGNLAEAYYWLGRTAHLLADMSSTAHTLNDVHLPIPWLSDNYEDFMGDPDPALRYKFRSIGHADSIQDVLNTYPSNPVWCDQDLSDLLFNLAENTDNFDSDDANGEGGAYPAINPIYRVGGGVHRIGRNTLEEGRVVESVWYRPLVGDPVQLLEHEDYEIVYASDCPAAGYESHIYYYWEFFWDHLVPPNFIQVQYTEGEPQNFHFISFALGGIWDQPLECIYQPQLEARAIGYTTQLFELFWDKTHEPADPPVPPDDPVVLTECEMTIRGWSSDFHTGRIQPNGQLLLSTSNNICYFSASETGEWETDTCFPASLFAANGFGSYSSNTQGLYWVDKDVWPGPIWLSFAEEDPDAPLGWVSIRGPQLPRSASPRLMAIGNYLLVSATTGITSYYAPLGMSWEARSTIPLDNPGTLTLAGDLLVVPRVGEINFIRANDLDALVLMGSVPSAGGVEEVSVVGDLLFSLLGGGGNTTFRVIDISNLYSPVELSRITIPEQYERGILCNERSCYVKPRSSMEFEIIDVNDPNNPYRVGRVPITGWHNPNLHIDWFQPLGNMAFAAGDHFWVFDRTSCDYVTFAHTPTNPVKNEFVTFTAFVAEEYAGLKWDFNGDGIPEAFGDTAVHHYDRAGPHTVTLTATSSDVQNRTVSGTVYVQGSEPGPRVTRVEREYPGVFLDGTTTNNTFDVEVDWEGSPGFVEFSVRTGAPVVVTGTATGASHTFDMGADFPADWDASEITIRPTNGEGDPGAPWSEYVYVFPYPTWLDDALAFGFGDLTITANPEEVRADLECEFPVPHFRDGCTLDCAVDPGCDDCLRIPHFVPYIGGGFDILETYGQIEGHVSSTGVGGFSLYGQTGFYALGGGDTGGGVLGTASGSGDFTLFAPDGFDLVSASINLGLQGVLRKEVGIVEAIPQLAALVDIPIIGGPISWFNDRATLAGEIAPSLGFGANFVQDAAGDLVFSEGTGTLGLDLKATLNIDIVDDHMSATGWVGGGGSFTLGVPEPFLRQMEVHFQAGVAFDFDFLLTYHAEAVFNAGCTWTPATGTVCDTGGPTFVDSYPPGHPQANPASGPSISELLFDYGQHGEYSRFEPTPLAMSASPKVPISVAESRLVSNVFPGASPELIEVGTGRLLLWEHQDLGDPILQSTEIAWSYFDGAEWTIPAIVLDDTQVELAPVAGVDAFGNVVAAWLRIKDPAFSGTINDPIDLPLFYTELEVVSAVFDPISQTWGGISSVTNDAALDTNLQLSADAAGNLLLTWLANPDGEFLSTVTSPSALIFSTWNGSAWSPPATVLTGLVGVKQHSPAINGSDAFTIIARDPDAQVDDDGVLELVTWNGSNWSSASIFASGGVENRLPTAAYDAGGEGHIVWSRGGDLVHATLSNPTPETVRSGSDSMAFYSADLSNNLAGNLTLVWQEVIDNGPANIVAKIYDSTSGVWSEDRRLSEDSWKAHQLSGFYGSAGVYHAAYLATEVLRVTEDVDIGGQIWTMTNLPMNGQTDLRMLEHSLVVDLATDDSVMSATPPTPASGDTVLVTLHVFNAGDFSTTGFVVDLYVGNPDGGGVVVDSNAVTGPFPAGASAELGFMFTWPGGADNIVAVVDAADSVSEISEDNNRATIYIDNRAPEARINVSTSFGDPPLAVDFDGSLSFDSDGDELEMMWSFSDGTDSESGLAVSHIFGDAGRYPVTLSVTDEHGAVGTATALIWVGWQDADADDVPDWEDNCPYRVNPLQEDVDGDGVGDICDNCPDEPNPDQLDPDNDWLGNACDGCPNNPDLDCLLEDGFESGDTGEWSTVVP